MNKIKICTNVVLIMSYIWCTQEKCVLKLSDMKWGILQKKQQDFIPVHHLIALFVIFLVLLL